jgi:DNA-binding LytR/AlgR family response regulator
MPEQGHLRTIIADDEPLAVERLQMLCADQTDIALVGTATNGAAALRMIAALNPDLIFLDIDMPEMDGMTAAREIARTPAPPAIVFVTALERFAIDAFDLSAADYLLKPISAERLARAIIRVKARRSKAPAPVSAHAEEFWVPHRSELIRIAAVDIERIDAERDYMRLHVSGRSYLLHQTISALEARLDPARFIRVHRSVILRRDQITRLGHDRVGAWHAELLGGGSVRIGRTYLAAAKAMAGR